MRITRRRLLPRVRLTGQGAVWLPRRRRLRRHSDVKRTGPPFPQHLADDRLRTGDRRDSCTRVPGAHSSGMDKPTEQFVTASGPADIIAVVPYLLGFHPRESIVALVVRRGLVEVSARWDTPSTSAQWEALRDQLDRLVSRWDDALPGYVVFASDPTQARHTASMVMTVSTPHFLFAIATDGHQWWADGGMHLPGQPMSGAVPAIAADAVMHGMSARESRDRLADIYAPLPPESVATVAADRDRLRQAVRRRPLRRLCAALDALSGSDGRADDGALVEAGLIVGREQPWLYAWRGLRRDASDQQHTLWLTVLTRCVPADAPAVFALTGIAAWLAGDGAAAAICLDKGQRLADGALGGLEVLRLIVDAAIPPDECDALPSALMGEMCDVGAER